MDFHTSGHRLTNVRTHASLCCSDHAIIVIFFCSRVLLNRTAAPATIIVKQARVVHVPTYHYMLVCHRQRPVKVTVLRTFLLVRSKNTDN